MVLYRICFFILLFSILYANVLHEKYPDEFDNILGGKLILQGIFPYSGFFSHHGLVPYLLSGVLSIFSGGSFVWFRIAYSIFLTFFLTGIYWYLRKSVGVYQTRVFLFFLPLLGIAMTYFWGHMFLADSLVALFLLPVIALFLLKTIYEKKITNSDLWFISILCFAALMSALTFIYAILFLYLFVLCTYITENSTKSFREKFGKPLAIFVLPFLVFFVYLLLTGSVKDYYWQAIDYNLKYYIYNYPYAPGSTTINPVRFAIVMTHNFSNNFLPLLYQIKDFNFATPFNITLALSVASILAYLFVKRYYLLFFIFLFVMIFANARSNPLDSKETDYQSAVYIVAALFSMCLILSRLWEELENTKISLAHKTIFSFLFLILGIYSFFMVGFLFNKFFDKIFNKYMGTAALIYDRPVIAPVLNNLIEKDDPIWIGPLEFEEMLALSGRPASKYHILLPGMGKSEKIQQELLADFEKNKPSLVWFDKNFFILGQNPQQYAQFFLQYLSKHYQTLYTYHNGNIRYRVIMPMDSRVDLAGKLYVRKEVLPAIIQKMFAKGFLEEEKVE